jgi:hypothetical protein
MKLESRVNSTIASRFIEEISIIIAAQDLTPTMMSQDFLKFSGIIPKDWELSQQPTLTPNYAQLNFKNGINIIAQPSTITFSESLNQKKVEEIQIPQVALKYVEKLPHAEYMGLSFSPKLLLPFPNDPDAARRYITGTLLGNGDWKKIGKAPLQAGVNLVFQLERAQLTMGISEARLQQPQQPSMFSILFSGNFNYNINTEKSNQTKIERLLQAINFWQKDLQDFREIVTEKFLAAQSGLGQMPTETTVFAIDTL